MKKILKVIGYILATIIVIALLTYGYFYYQWTTVSKTNLANLGKEAPILTATGHTFRDLNKNGQLDVYEDNRAPIEARVNDLLDQMTLEEKAGTMFITMIAMSNNGELMEIPSLTNPISIAFGANSTMVVQKKMNHFNLLMTPAPDLMVKWHNNIQKLAERTRLGIPVTIASDPRHGTKQNIGAGIAMKDFSQWPSPLGLAAIGDTALTREFGDIARQELMATGIRLTLSPMADLATEPRWARTDGTFGEDAYLSAQQTKAYILGFQGDSLTNQSVACMTKHFSGGGPQKDGEDAHFAYGADQAYPGNNFDYHLIPFEGAFAAKTAQIMPYYGIPVGQTNEEVAFAFNKEIITDLLRDKYGFNGVVCTDWGVISDMMMKPASAWGVEDLTYAERVAKALNAGCDMFGGEEKPELVVEVVENGTIKERDIDNSVRRILRDKFKLGLFDNPYLSDDSAKEVGNATFRQKGRAAQRRAITLLKNENNILPLPPDAKIYIQGLDQNAAKPFAKVVDNSSDADFIVLGLETPKGKPKGNALLENMFDRGRLNFTKEEKAELIPLIEQKPTITVLTIGRPPIVPEINAKSKAVLADFYCEHEVIFEIIFGKYSPQGKLPLEIPSSVEAVTNQKEDMPYDSKDPLYPFGHGLSYTSLLGQHSLN